MLGALSSLTIQHEPMPFYARPSIDTKNTTMYSKNEGEDIKQKREREKVEEK